ncbi:hypothetical protein E1265_29900 [Streptomyces sp. 8K308]|uniref:hypothetical protein n=1 Tax=Streptomyces sp. 8K308 TaxID=2530388 RepID=UPI00104499CD|nr:hypothetical protein [Streptomyces sp. 8K308]TDC11375.1 hypothetical protein E1265_29900 [Streptomyces sp. 8K308]
MGHAPARRPPWNAYLTATRNVFLNTAGQWAHANNQNGNRTGDQTLTRNHATNPAITGLVTGERGNTVEGTVVFTPGDIPAEARQIIADAGPRGTHHDPS